MHRTIAATLLAGIVLAGVGPHSCIQLTDTGRLILHSEGTPSPRITAWLAGPQVTTMPQELVAVWERLQPCLPGKNHS